MRLTGASAVPVQLSAPADAATADDAAITWALDVDLYFDASAASIVNVTLSVTETGATMTSQVKVAAGEQEVTIRMAHVGAVQRWWPNGYGKQPLYHLNVSYNYVGAPPSGIVLCRPLATWSTLR